MAGNKYIIFDFDGTIADTIELGLSTFNSIASEYDCKPVKEKDLAMLRTMRPQELVKAYGISNIKLTLILLRVRKELKARIHELKPVKGIFNSLIEIKNSGLRMGILTSNSRKNVEMFLDNNQMSDFVDFIYSGKSLFGKNLILKKLFDNENILKDNAIYVGDETRDIEASKRIGIPVIAVVWGFHDREILASLNPDQIAETPEDLFGCVQKILSKHIT